MSDLVGQQWGNYRLMRLLGQGGFAQVDLGKHLRLNMFAAIKILHTQLSELGVQSTVDRVAGGKHANLSDAER